MKIAITGCAGFIGSHFSLYILEKYPDATVVGIDFLTYAACDAALERLLGYDRFRFYRENIADRLAMERVFDAERPDVVVNFAAESHVDNSIENAERFIETNVLGTGVLLDASVKYGVKRFHQISTDEVYGDLPLDSDRCFAESSPLNPSSPYSASKAAADFLALSYMRTHRLPVSISRSSNNYGIYQHSEKLIPMTVGKILSGEPVPIYGDGSNMRDWLFVADHCRAVDLIIRAGECGIYNVGAGNEWKNIDLVRKIADTLGKPDAKIEFVEDRKGHDRRYPIDSTKIRALGWRPEAEFDEMLKNAIEWYIRKGECKKENENE